VVCDTDILLRKYYGIGSVLQLLSRVLLRTTTYSLDSNLHSPSRRLIELRMEHADFDASIDRLSEQKGDAPVDELLLRRLKKRRLALRDQIARLDSALDGNEPA
jgi:hypothetical protein